MNGKRFLSWALSLAMVLGIMPTMNLTAFAEGETPSSYTVTVGGVALTTDGAPSYAVTDNDGNVTTSGANDSNYNIKLDLNDGETAPTLTLRGATIKNTETFDAATTTDKGHGIYAECDLTIVGDTGTEGSPITPSTIADATADGICVKGNLTIKGTLGDINAKDYLDGTLHLDEDINDYTATFGNAVYAEKKLTIEGKVGNLYGGSGISATDDITISGTVGNIKSNVHFPDNHVANNIYTGNGILSKEGNITISGTVGDISKKDDYINDENLCVLYKEFSKGIYAGGKYENDAYVSGGTITITGTVGEIGCITASGNLDNNNFCCIKAYDLIVGKEDGSASAYVGKLMYSYHGIYATNSVTVHENARMEGIMSTQCGINTRTLTVNGSVNGIYNISKDNSYGVCADSVTINGFFWQTDAKTGNQIKNLTIKSGADWDNRCKTEVYNSFTVEEGHNFKNSSGLCIYYPISDNFESVSAEIASWNLINGGGYVHVIENGNTYTYTNYGIPHFTVLYLNGEQISQDSELPDGETYDFRGHTLTLNNATLTGDTDSGKPAVYAKGDLNINLTGDNIITSPNGGISVIDTGFSGFSGALTFNGENTISQKSVIEIDDVGSVELADGATLTNNGIVYLANVSADGDYLSNIPSCFKKTENGITTPNGCVILGGNGRDFRWLGPDENGEQRLVRDLTFTGLDLTDDTLSENTEYPAGLGTVSFAKSVDAESGKTTAVVNLNNASFYVTKSDVTVDLPVIGATDYACAIYAEDTDVTVNGTADTINVNTDADGACGIYIQDTNESDDMNCDLTVNANIENMSVSGDAWSTGITGGNVALNGTIGDIAVKGNDESYGIYSSMDINVNGKVGNINTSASGWTSAVNSSADVNIKGSIGDIAINGTAANTDASGIIGRNVTIDGITGKINVTGGDGSMGIQSLYGDIVLNAPIDVTVNDGENSNALHAFNGNITLGNRMIIRIPSGGKVTTCQGGNSGNGFVFNYSFISDENDNPAKAVLITRRSSSNGSSGKVNKVTFDTNGGSKISSVSIGNNDSVTEPTEPTRDGYTFGGWYSDKELTKPYDFDTSVTQPTTLYAKWIENEIEPTEPTTPSEPTDERNPFADVKSSDWYYESVKYAFENGLMNGVSDTTFAPNDNLTRAMLVTILYRAEGEPAVNKSIPFNDVDMGEYYANAVIWGKQNGIIEGHTETEFAPNDSITREQIAAIMYRYASYKGIAPKGAWAIRLDYADIADVADYAGAGVMYCTKDGLMRGKDNNMFCPKDNATRAEIAAILQRFIELNK